MSNRREKSRKIQNKLYKESLRIQHSRIKSKFMDPRLPNLPIELIRCITFYLNDLNDIKQLMLVSKDIRNLIFGIPDVMKAMSIKLSNDISYEEALSFLKVRGAFIKNLSFEPAWGSLKSLSHLLTLVPNLEELYINTSETDDEKVKSVALKLNTLDTDDQQDSMHDSLSLKRLKIMSINVLEVDDEEILTNLIVHQKRLEHLTLAIGSMKEPNFPCRDFSQEVNFKLKTLKLSIPAINQANFIKFFNTQASNLEELELNFITDPKIILFIFKFFKNLKKFTIDEDGSDVIFSESFPDLKLENLKYFHDKNQNGTIVTKLFERFPNIETLKCCDMMKATGTYPTLTTLDVSEVYWPRIRNLMMPNLKNLFIKKIYRCDDEYYWMHFSTKFLNVENITVEKVGNEGKDVLRFVKRLKTFKKLKTFKLRHGNSINLDYKLDENEQVEVENNFYKILIDTTSRTVKSSSHIVQNQRIIQKHLLLTFKGFEFFEFCFPELRVRRINYII
ncbi:uncharacterized protein [Chironomus tepperi]|uniref:uncharacterized protein n=1 Tax=Chironomus tepperi TaxID=113505 RepID=UPI00391F1F41